MLTSCPPYITWWVTCYAHSTGEETKAQKVHDWPKIPQLVSAAATHALIVLPLRPVLCSVSSCQLPGLWRQRKDQSRNFKYKERMEKWMREAKTGGLGRNGGKDTSPAFPLLHSQSSLLRPVGGRHPVGLLMRTVLTPQCRYAQSSGHRVKPGLSSSFFLGMKWRAETSGRQLWILNSSL